MNKSLRRATTFVFVPLLCLTWLLLPGARVSATHKPGGVPGTVISVASPASQKLERETIVRVTVRNDSERQKLAGTGVNILTGSTGGVVYIQTTTDKAEALRLEGWTTKVLYSQGEDGVWRYFDIVADDCTASISPTDMSFAEMGGTNSFQLTIGSVCEWTVLTDQSWITINGAVQGTGPHTFSYTVGTNPGVRRQGNIFVAGQVFTVLQGAAFADVPRNYLFYSEIGRLSARGVTVGCSEDHYCPEVIVTRDQMAAFIIRALGDFDPPTPASQRYTDVPPSSVFYAFVEEMAVRNITLGCGGGNYCPIESVLREQTAAFLIRALGEFNPPTPATQRFEDVPPSNQFYNFIDRLAALNITNGCGGNSFCPKQPLTRGQMAALLVRAFNL